MYGRFMDAAQWRRLLVRGEFVRITDSRVVQWVYGAWLGIFALKLIGSTWDVGWHFRFLRDDLAPPHIINTIGMVLGIGLLIFQSWSGLATERRGLYWLQAGVMVFLAAIPLDLLNHRWNGLDLTSWSATHFMLYLGTAGMLIGVIRIWGILGRATRWWLPVALGFWLFLLEDMLFPLGQQEYGTLSLAAFLAGRTTADAELVQAGGANIATFALGAIPLWLYPVYFMTMSTLVLGSARAFIGWRWTATTLAALYLAYRAVAYLLLRAGGFPPSFIPWMLLGAGLVIDLAAHRRWQPMATALAIVGVVYGLALLIGQWTLMPAFSVLTAPVVAVLIALGYAALPWWQARGRRWVLALDD